MQTQHRTRVNIEFPRPYIVRLESTCCFSGYTTVARVRTKPRARFFDVRIAPSRRILEAGGRERKPCPQFSDIDLGGNAVFREVPNDMFIQFGG